jgi:hypothetical protein
MQDLLFKNAYNGALALNLDWKSKIAHLMIFQNPLL